MLERIARWSYRRRWAVVGIWAVALIGTNFLGSSAGGEFSQDFSLPGSESQKATDLLRERFPEFAGDTAEIVFKTEDGVDDPEVKATMEKLFAEIQDIKHVIGVNSPYSEQGAAQISEDGTIAFATIRFEDLGGEPIPIEVGKKILALGDKYERPGLTIEPGGNVIIFSEFEEPGAAEGVGFLAAILILLIVFGSVLAMALPILMALIGIGIGMALIMI
ncbi:MAG TPA: MMPL family transporter, partial [Actinomycetota bacterium]|nr:MMPL family transporter [Actinomycetota bacterium]